MLGIFIDETLTGIFTRHERSNLSGCFTQDYLLVPEDCYDLLDKENNSQEYIKRIWLWHRLLSLVVYWQNCKTTEGKARLEQLMMETAHQVSGMKVKLEEEQLTIESDGWSHTFSSWAWTLQSHLVCQREILLMMKDILMVRWNILCYTNLAHIIQSDQRITSSFRKKLQLLFLNLDRGLMRVGNPCYKLVKLHESISVSLLLQRDNERILEETGVNMEVSNFSSQMNQEWESVAEENQLEQEAKIHRLILQGLNDHELLQVYVLFRSWGHPVLDVPASLTKQHRNTHNPRAVDPLFMSKLASNMARRLIISYYKEHGEWPPDTKTPAECGTVLQECVTWNRLPTVSEMDKIPQKWHLIQHGKLYDLPDVLPNELLLDDKAHSLTKGPLTLGKRNNRPSFIQKSSVDYTSVRGI